MATKPTAELDRLARVNGEFYDATANPFGLGNGGHRQVFPKALQDFSVVGNFVAITADEVWQLRQATSDDRRQTGQDRAAAAASAAAAATFNPANYVRSDSPGRLGIEWTGNALLMKIDGSATALAFRDDVNNALSGKMDKGGGTFTGDVTVLNGELEIADTQGIAPSLRFQRLGVKNARLALDHNGNLVWVDDGLGRIHFRLGPDGSIFTEQLGDLNTRIENRAAAFADNRAAGRVAKTGDEMTGPLEIIGIGVAPSLWFHRGGVKRARWCITVDGALTYQDQSGTDHFKIFGDGSVWTQQLGDLFTALNARPIGDSAKVVGFAGGNPDLPYMRGVNDQVYYLARRGETDAAINSKMPLPEVSNNPDVTNFPIGTVLIALYASGGLTIRQYISLGKGAGAAAYYQVNGSIPLAGTWVVLGLTGFLSPNSASPVYACQRIA
ncbi:hypothetical protein [Aureimonas mangrovi]|uniref:hypothetical protein n=1 Tax=Aureimonas mangrovi TaxID=2758041 RepID=UPI00163DA6DD|nr:hypothetical protein [Aureimonas mangrovi]